MLSSWSRSVLGQWKAVMALGMMVGIFLAWDISSWGHKHSMVTLHSLIPRSKGGRWKWLGKETKLHDLDISKAQFKS